MKIVDYSYDLILPLRNRNWQQIEEVLKQLREIALKHSIVIITAKSPNK